jgi:hypothetical protein
MNKFTVNLFLLGSWLECNAILIRLQALQSLSNHTLVLHPLHFATLVPDDLCENTTCYSFEKKPPIGIIVQC